MSDALIAAVKSAHCLEINREIPHNQRTFLPDGAWKSDRDSPSTLVRLLLILRQDSLRPDLCPRRVEQRLLLPTLILELHQSIPMTRNFPSRTFRPSNVPGDSVISSRDPTLGLPFDITRVMGGGTGDSGAVSKFEHHLAEQDSSGEHVGHLHRSEPNLSTLV